MKDCPPEVKWHNNLKTYEIIGVDIDSDGKCTILTDEGVINFGSGWTVRNNPKAGMILVYKDDKGFYCMPKSVGIPI